MSLFENFLMYDLCFPGVITGETKVECPYCKKLLLVEEAHKLLLIGDNKRKLFTEMVILNSSKLSQRGMNVFRSYSDTIF